MIVPELDFLEVSEVQDHPVRAADLDVIADHECELSPSHEPGCSCAFTLSSSPLFLKSPFNIFIKPRACL